MIVAIVQARMGSSRLPGKVLASVNGKPMLWYVLNRLSGVDAIDKVVVATSEKGADDPIEAFCSSNDFNCFRGSETDVLDRYYRAAKAYSADPVVRVTADCPLLDPEIVEKLIDTYKNSKYDYVTNTLRYTYPDGLDAEIFSFTALEKAWREAGKLSEREHVTVYLRNSDQFRVYNVENDVSLPDSYLRWTVDEPSDLEFVRAVYQHIELDPTRFGQRDVLRLLVAQPDLMGINSGIICNAGFYTSLATESPLPPRHQKLTRSYELKAKAERLIPSCSQTFSKGPSQFVQGPAPVFLQRGQGSHVWDVDDNEYIDYPMALGPIILGHNYALVSEAVTRQIQDGTTFSLPHPLELEISELLAQIVPCAEMVRFGKNGSDATSGAVRLCRAYTGREIIACCGYHGWQDWYIGTTTRDKGIPDSVKKLTIPFEYNRINSLESIFAEHPGQVAGVIMEPVGLVAPHDGFLQNVRALTEKEGALLVFDEIITGFRLALGGAQERFGVIPDLACLGKAMANGYPLSAVVGRREIMELFDEVFFSFTFGGETLSLAACRATIEEMRSKNVIEHLWEQGAKLQNGYNVLAEEFDLGKRTRCIGLPPRTVISFQDLAGSESLLFKSLFQQECLRRGVLFSGGHNICYSHTNSDIEETLRVYRAGLEILAQSIANGDVEQRLNSRPVEPVFRKN